ncbi:hypothetical protein DCO58_02180 [Helicobacter saguini]|uniref:Uncharacterized protein n=1 Tax=Helicobacter saguini TaxID=1548018 RepID=A0A347VRQ5_9HELI|nr:hypothetical protein [Helicobacter saguini]MWV62816.1 hypothetical protein [Helicobacter saguini]MWV66515.1 hypothetical protein [Helicobacter saguini]MWV68864.1 hypothetical protein [Helicobacter saguini]MWV71581.1 hypothetical protein [Helicobacter saguini]TLD94387.1 hypothetical protein LS64_005495 [Helicobacter saguini]
MISDKQKENSLNAIKDLRLLLDSLESSINEYAKDSKNTKARDNVVNIVRNEFQRKSFNLYDNVRTID